MSTEPLLSDVLVPLPPSVCVRVTRACNARCGFCLAPPTGHGVSYGEIIRRLQWLADRGVRKVNLSGGEPTIRADLADVVATVRDLGLKCAMTTNGIRLSDPVLAALVTAAARVKVSVHGPEDVHDRMLGVPCFTQVDDNVLRLQDAGVAVAIQTVLTSQHPDVHGWVIDYCLRRGVRKLRFVPFVPRGRGIMNADAYQMTFAERDRTTARIEAARRDLAGCLDVDVLDFWTQEYYVMETDGKLEVQRETDAADTTVARIGAMPLTPA